MRQPAAKQGDLIIAQDTHLIVMPNGATAPVPGHIFNGVLSEALSADVNIMGVPAATVDSIADNTPPHLPLGGSFSKFPTNKGKVMQGSSSVMINGRSAARNGDVAETCNDPVDLPNGKIVAVGTVMIG